MFEELPRLTIGTNEIELEVISEPFVEIGFRKSYVPCIAVKSIYNNLQYKLIISAASIGEMLEPMRINNDNRFEGLKFSIKRESEERMAKYILSEI